MNNVTEDKSSLDVSVSKALSGTYGNLSRRSFLSMMTRKLIGLTGIVIAAEVLPYVAGPAYGDTSCGLHGYPCEGGCGGGGVGTSWVQCCQQGTGTSCSFACCRHTDYCGTPPEGYPDGCSGHASGLAWCGGASGYYICTESSCTPGFLSMGQCAMGCNGPAC